MEPAPSQPPRYVPHLSGLGLRPLAGPMCPQAHRGQAEAQVQECAECDRERKDAAEVAPASAQQCCGRAPREECRAGRKQNHHQGRDTDGDYELRE